MNDRKLDRDQLHRIEQKRQFERKVLQSAIEQDTKGVVEPIVDSVLSILSQPSFSKGIEAEIQTGGNDFRTVAQESVVINSEDFLICCEVKVIKEPQLSVRFGISVPNSQPTPNTSPYGAFMNNFVCIRDFDFLLNTPEDIEIVSWVGTHQDYSGRGLATALIMCSHEVIRSVLPILQNHLEIVKSCTAIITDNAEASLLQKPRQQWSTTMAEALGYHPANLGKSNEFTYEYI